MVVVFRACIICAFHILWFGGRDGGDARKGPRGDAVADEFGACGGKVILVALSFFNQIMYGAMFRVLSHEL